MANYFTSANDAAYLDATTAARGDLPLLRTDAEALVIAQYRRRVRDVRNTALAGHATHELTGGLENLSSSAGDAGVMLRWYHADADDVGATAQELIFLDAIRHEIAGVIMHLASKRPDGGASERAIQSERRGRRSVTYADTAGQSSDLPSNFGIYLKSFDLREVVWV